MKKLWIGALAAGWVLLFLLAGAAPFGLGVASQAAESPRLGEALAWPERIAITPALDGGEHLIYLPPKPRRIRWTINSVHSHSMLTL